MKYDWKERVVSRLNVILGTFLGLVLTLSLAAQPSKTPLLERAVTVTFVEEPLPAVLKKIADQAGFSFSYKSDLIDGSRRISDRFVNMTVREILDQLFGGSLQYKERKKHVILTKAETSSSNEEQKVSGYVVDEATGQRVKNASIYDPVSMSSAVTDSYGYFQLEVPKPSNEELKLTIKKLHYADTVVVVTKGKQGLIHIPIKIDEDKIEAVADSIGVNLKRFWLSTKKLTEQIVNMENIEDTLHADFQISVVPFVGTNRKLSGNVVNDYSFNVLGGYSLGVQKFEVGTWFNAVRGDVNGVQLAGLVNAVGGETKGFQMAGWINANRGPTSGAQVAGLINFNWSMSRDFAAAGLINFSYHDSEGVKLAGLGNTTIGEQRGPHFAGLFNFSAGRTSSAQVAGILNYSAKEMQGTQVSGILNITPSSINGAQIGLVNYASSVKGAQIGFLNMADSMKGIPIGFLSFVNRGYHKIELSADEIFYTNLAFRTGVSEFYNIFALGAKPDSFKDEPFWTFGYGVGSSPKLSRRLYLNVDLTANQIVNGTSIEAINLLNKLYVGLEFQAARKFSITVGATLNGYITDTTYDGYSELFTDYKPDIIAEEDLDNNLNLKMWWGGKVGIRFL